MTIKSSEKLVGALVGGLRVIRYLSSMSTGVGVTRIAKDLSLNPSTCYNFLKTLVHERLVIFDETTKTYSISLGMVELAKGVLEQSSYVRLIRPYMEEIVARYLVTATLWQSVDDERVVLVDRADNNSAMRVHMSVGQRLPKYIAALGRCMAAYSGLSQTELEEKFNTLRWDNKPLFKDYVESIEEVKELGYAIDAGNYVKGVSTVSVPILDASGKAVMAISAVGFSTHFSQNELRNLGEYLHEIALEIGNAMSGASSKIKN